MIVRDAALSEFYLTRIHDLGVFKIFSSRQLLHHSHFPDLKVEPLTLLLLERPIPLRLKHLIREPLEVLQLSQLFIPLFKKLI